MIATLPSQVVNEMAQRHHRFHHYIWHRVHNTWLQLKEAERQAIRNIKYLWEPPRPARDEMGRPIRDNDSGEDFFFMHRQMISFVNGILSAVGDASYPRVEGWKRVPLPTDADYPVPNFPGSGLEEIKSVEYFEQFIARWESQYTDSDYLCTVTLGQLGSEIEFTIHNDMHMRWATPSTVGYRPSTFITQSINEHWDAAAYNYLGDTYSSHVNPVFWKLHGWVDNRIEDWKLANGVINEIAWKGTWIGPADHQHHEPHQAAAAIDSRTARTQMASASAHDELQQIDRIISASGASDFDGFFRPAARLLSPLKQGVSSDDAP